MDIAATGDGRTPGDREWSAAIMRTALFCPIRNPPIRNPQFPSMPLPDLIEIVPLTKAGSGANHRNCPVPETGIYEPCAYPRHALANGETKLQGALWSEDTQVMVDCLQKLRFNIHVAADPEEFCNRTITVQGLGGKIPNVFKHAGKTSRTFLSATRERRRDFWLPWSVWGMAFTACVVFRECMNVPSPRFFRRYVSWATALSQRMGTINYRREYLELSHFLAAQFNRCLQSLRKVLRCKVRAQVRATAR